MTSSSFLRVVVPFHSRLGEFYYHPGFPINILLSLLAALDVAGQNAEALRFSEWVTALLVISSIMYSGGQPLIELLLLSVGEVWVSPEWYMALSASIPRLVEEAELVLILGVG